MTMSSCANWALIDRVEEVAVALVRETPVAVPAYRDPLAASAIPGCNVWFVAMDNVANLAQPARLD
jgi:hypothetical protein